MLNEGDWDRTADPLVSGRLTLPPEPQLPWTVCMIYVLHISRTIHAITLTLCMCMVKGPNKYCVLDTQYV